MPSDSRFSCRGNLRQQPDTQPDRAPGRRVLRRFEAPFAKPRAEALERELRLVRSRCPGLERVVELGRSDSQTFGDPATLLQEAPDHIFVRAVLFGGVRDLLRITEPVALPIETAAHCPG